MEVEHKNMELRLQSVCFQELLGPSSMLPLLPPVSRASLQRSGCRGETTGQVSLFQRLRAHACRLLCDAEEAQRQKQADTALWERFITSSNDTCVL